MKKCFVRYVDGTDEVFENASIEVTSKNYVIRRNKGEVALAVAQSQVLRVADTPYPLQGQTAPGAGREEIEKWARDVGALVETPAAA